MWATAMFIDRLRNQDQDNIKMLLIHLKIVNALCLNTKIIMFPKTL